MSRKKILFVDDEKMIRDMLKEALSEAGYYVKIEENAEDTMDVLRQETSW